MAITQNTYTGNGSTVLFSFTFPYISTADIKVSLDGVPTTAYTLANATTIQFNTAPANGVAIRIFRQTDDTGLKAQFYTGSAIRSQDLNDNFSQSLYIAQETSNYSVQDVGSITLAGDYTFSQPITIPTPQSNFDAATKKYVDDAAFASGNLTLGNKGDITVNSANSWTINAGAGFLAPADIGVTVQAYDANLPAGNTILVDGDVGVTVQGYDADTAKLDVAQAFTAQQTFAELKETVFTLGTTGSIELDPANGSIQSSVLTGAPTFTDSLEAGQAIVLMLEGGDSNAVTWPTVTWVTSGGNVAPTLTAKDTLVLWKVSTTLYGAYVGSYV